MIEPSVPGGPTLADDGCEHFPLAALAEVERFPTPSLLSQTGRPGTRLNIDSKLADWITPISERLSAFSADSYRPVRAVLFDKSADTNWTLGWHQDRTINVRERRPVEGFGPWSLKSGCLHVEPPFEIIERMLTLRIHFDDTPSTNAPLLVAGGSHRLGKVASGQADKVVQSYSVIECAAGRGDVWLYATSILHRSKRASNPGRRRVLQVDFSAEELPGGLEWLGLEAQINDLA